MVKLAKNGAASIGFSTLGENLKRECKTKEREGALLKLKLETLLSYVQRGVDVERGEGALLKLKFYKVWFL